MALRERPAQGTLRVKEWSQLHTVQGSCPNSHACKSDLTGQAFLSLHGQNVLAGAGFTKAYLTEMCLLLRQGRGKAGEQGDQVT